MTNRLASSLATSDSRSFNAPLAMLDHYVPALQSYYAIAIDVGTKDSLVASNRQLHEAMMRLRIAQLNECSF